MTYSRHRNPSIAIMMLWVCTIPQNVSRASSSPSASPCPEPLCPFGHSPSPITVESNFGAHSPALDRRFHACFQAGKLKQVTPTANSILAANSTRAQFRENSMPVRAARRYIPPQMVGMIVRNPNKRTSVIWILLFTGIISFQIVLLGRHARVKLRMTCRTVCTTTNLAGLTGNLPLIIVAMAFVWNQISFGTIAWVDTYDNYPESVQE